jgi:DNA-binding NarL/FixJ family response regulator
MGMTRGVTPGEHACGVEPDARRASALQEETAQLEQALDALCVGLRTLGAAERTGADWAEAADGAGAAVRVAGAGELLTGRELVALQLVARGYTHRQVAVLLRSTPAEMTFLLEQAAGRLKAADVTEAVAAATRRGLLA